jgi:hypothetical protein
MSHFEDDMGAWETGELSITDVATKHPDTDVSALVALHESLATLASTPVPDPEMSWQRLQAQLPDRSGLADRARGWIRRPLMVVVATAALSTGAAYAAGLEPQRGVQWVWEKVTGTAPSVEKADLENGTNEQKPGSIHDVETVEGNDASNGSGTDSPAKNEDRGDDRGDGADDDSQGRDDSDGSSASGSDDEAGDDSPNSGSDSVNSGPGSVDDPNDGGDSDNSGPGSDGSDDDHSGSGTSGSGSDTDEDNSGSGSSGSDDDDSSGSGSSGSGVDGSDSGTSGSGDDLIDDHSGSGGDDDPVGAIDADHSGSGSSGGSDDSDSGSGSGSSGSGGSGGGSDDVWI